MTTPAGGYQHSLPCDLDIEFGQPFKIFNVVNNFHFQGRTGNLVNINSTHHHPVGSAI